MSASSASDSPGSHRAYAATTASTPVARRTTTPPSSSAALTANPLLDTVAEQQQQLYKVQGDLARSRAQLTAAKEELLSAQQQLSAAKADATASQAERDDVQERLRRCQDQLERARRDAAEASLKCVSLSAERDDLAEKVREAWDRVASLGRQLSEAERRASTSPSPSSPSPATLSIDAGRNEEAHHAMTLLVETHKHQLTLAQSELETLRARCSELERTLSLGSHSQQRAADAHADHLSALTTILDKLRGVHVRRLLPLDKVTAAPVHSITEVDRREVLSNLDSLESELGASRDAAPLKPLARATRALVNLLDAIHEDALRVAAARAELVQARDAADARAQRAQAEAARLQQDAASAMQSIKSQQHAVTQQERDGTAACRALAATLHCLEDWPMVRHRVQHLQQQAQEWEREVGRARQQLAEARTTAEAAMRQQATEHRGERAALSEENRRLKNELAALRDAHEALRLEHDYKAQAGNAVATVTANNTAALTAQANTLAAELDKLRREHASLQAAYAEALRCIEEELEPFAEEQERSAHQAQAHIERLIEDKEKLYEVVDLLRAQLKDLRATKGLGALEGEAAADTSRALPPATAPLRSDNSGNHSIHRIHREKERQQQQPQPSRRPDPPARGAARPRRQEPDGAVVSSVDSSLGHNRSGAEAPQGNTSGASQPVSRAPMTSVDPSPNGSTALPYPAPILVSRQGSDTAQSPGHDSPGAVSQEEEALLASIQRDRREAAYTLGRPHLSTQRSGLPDTSAVSGSSGVGSVGMGLRPALPAASNKFATEVLGVIEALDKRVTGALQRRTQAEA